LGMENVKEHELQLTKYILKLLQEDDSISVYGPKDTSIRCGIVSFNIKNIDYHDVALLLDNEGIMVRSGYHCAEPLHQRLGLSGSVRASFYIYNTKEEVEKFFEALKEIGNVG
ncbi:MAG: aminotransferase class V-fold PLP-dependent enzyme, partial [Nitrososphaeria archaeon]